MSSRKYGRHWTASLFGIILYGGNQNVISGCECFGNQSSMFQYPNPQEGIALLTSNENTISNNVVSGNFNGIGLWGYGCNDNVLAGNNVSFNFNNGFDIVGLDNNITFNHIWNDGNGVLLDHASGTIINDNDISNSTMSGVYISLGDTNNTISENTIQTNQYSIFIEWNSGNNNSFYHNNFVGNTFPIYVPPNLLYTWDDGYPSGGNYWSDYNGTEANHDGIGDTPYVIDANNVDHDPLMGHFESFNVSTWSHPNDGFEEVDVISNFTISNLGLYEWLTTPNQYLQAGQLFLRLVPVQGQNMTAGFCRMTLPNNILNASYYIVLIDMTPIIVNKLAISNDTHSTLYFTFNTSAIEGIIITPEFPSFLILPLFFIITPLAVTVYRRKGLKTGQS